MTEAPPRRADGQETHEQILDAAMRLASVEGLGSLTIGRLAREVGLSKSGLFAHFRSKERLQRDTIKAAGAVFQREVLDPARAAPEGLRRLESMCEAYLSYIERGVFPGGCFFAHLLAEFDAPSGPIHDEMVEIQRGWMTLLEGEIDTARRQGELHPETDAAQLAFELYAPLELANYLATLHRDPGIVDRARVAIRTALATSTKGTGHDADE